MQIAIAATHQVMEGMVQQFGGDSMLSVLFLLRFASVFCLRGGGACAMSGCVGRVVLLEDGLIGLGLVCGASMGVRGGCWS